MTEAKPCIVCGEQLYNVVDEVTNQPYEGTAFTTGGHYGSTVFDPMDGTYLELNICDECLVKARDKCQVLIGRQSKLVRFDGSIVGWTPTPNRPLLDWTGNEVPAYEDELPGDDILDVDVDDLEHPERVPEIHWNVPPEDLLESYYREEVKNEPDL
jgi:hypothetical protein